MSMQRWKFELILSTVELIFAPRTCWRYGLNHLTTKFQDGISCMVCLKTMNSLERRFIWKLLETITQHGLLIFKHMMPLVGTSWAGGLIRWFRIATLFADRAISFLAEVSAKRT